MSLEAAIQNLADAIKEYGQIVKSQQFVLGTCESSSPLESLGATTTILPTGTKKSKTEEIPPAENVAPDGKTEAEIRAEALGKPDGYCYKLQIELSKGANREAVQDVLKIFGATVIDDCKIPTVKGIPTKAIPEFHKALLAALGKKKNVAPEEKVVEGVVETADELADQPLEKDDPEFAKLFDVATGAISVPYLKIKKNPDHKDWADEIMAKFGVPRPSLVPRGRLKELQIEISNYTARASAGA